MSDKRGVMCGGGVATNLPSGGARNDRGARGWRASLCSATSADHVASLPRRNNRPTYANIVVTLTQEISEGLRHGHRISLSRTYLSRNKQLTVLESAASSWRGCVCSFVDKGAAQKQTSLVPHRKGRLHPSQAPAALSKIGNSSHLA